jgi:hypothetical protein
VRRPPLVKEDRLLLARCVSWQMSAFDCLADMIAAERNAPGAGRIDFRFLGFATLLDS